MPYPGQFHRLVIMGTLYSDVFNTTLSIVPSALGEIGMPAIDTLTLEAVADDVETWWSASSTTVGPVFISNARLTGIKLNRIGTDGHYVDPETMEYTYPSPVLGLNSGLYAPQLATVATLRTAIPRGRGSKGRMYLPPNIAMQSLAGDGRMTVGAAEGLATATVALINALNFTFALVGRVGVASDAGAGRFEHVTEVSAGRVIDTIRSRRSALAEDYQTVPV